MDEQGKNVEADKGSDEVGEKISEQVKETEYASSDSSYDLCEDLNDTGGDSDGYVKVGSQGSSSDFDLCEDPGACSIAESANSSDVASSAAVSEAESDLGEEFGASSSEESTSSSEVASSAAVSEAESDLGEEFGASSSEESASSSEVASSAAVSEAELDLGEEFGASSSEESASTSEVAASGAVSEAEYDFASSQVSRDHIRRLRTAEFHRRYTENLMLTVPYNDVHMTEAEFKQLRLRKIVEELVLPYLPAKSLTRFRSVSKEWDRRITSPLFANHQSISFRDISGYFCQQYNRSIRFLSLCRDAYGIPNLEFIPQRATLISSCNGLLLYRTTEADITYYICNPCTKKSRQLPRPSFYHGEDPAAVLAFEPSAKDLEANYHVVCAFHRLDEPVLCFEIFSSKKNAWEVLDELCTDLGDVDLKNNGFYFNGTAYWETMSNDVLALDLEGKIHDVFPLPPNMPTGSALGQIKGELCYVTARQFQGSTVEVSFYKGIGSMDLYRTFHFNLGLECFQRFQVLPCLCDDTVMILADGCLYSCRLHDRSVQAHYHYLNPDWKYLPYINSLVFVA